MSSEVLVIILMIIDMFFPQLNEKLFKQALSTELTWQHHVIIGGNDFFLLDLSMFKVSSGVWA
jgi:hypothetical protein